MAGSGRVANSQMGQRDRPLSSGPLCSPSAEGFRLPVCNTVKRGQPGRICVKAGPGKVANGRRVQRGRLLSSGPLCSPSAEGFRSPVCNASRWGLAMGGASEC